MTDVYELLSELADEIDRSAKYFRVAVKYGEGTDADRMFIVATESAAGKVRDRMRAHEFERIQAEAKV